MAKDVDAQYRTHIADGILEKRRILLAVMPAGFCVIITH